MLSSILDMRQIAFPTRLMPGTKVGPDTMRYALPTPPGG